MLFRIEKLGSSPTNIEQCKICKKGMIMKIILVDCSHEFCYDCLYEITETSDGCPQCKDSKRDSNMEELEDKIVEREAECSICLAEKQNKALVGSCFHSFCFKCITDWSKMARHCPLCRGVFSEIYHDIKDDRTFKTFRPRSEEFFPFSTDYSNIFNREEEQMRINSLLNKMRNRNRVDRRLENDYHDNRINRNERDQTFWHAYENRSVVQNNDGQPNVSDLLRHQASRWSRRREDESDVSAARFDRLPRPNLLGRSMEASQRGLSFQEFLGERSFRRRTSSDSEDSSVIQSSRQSQAATKTKQVRFTVHHHAPEEQVTNQETTMSNTPGVHRVLENNSRGRRETGKLSMRSPTRWPRRLSNGSESGSHDRMTAQTSPNPSHVRDDSRVNDNPEIPQESVSSSNGRRGKKGRHDFLNGFIQFTDKVKRLCTDIKNNKL